MDELCGIEIYIKFGANVTSQYDYSIDETWDKIINSYSKGSVRIYEMSWGIAYTTDGGASFKGAARDEYTDCYRADKEFAAVYAMLHYQPFYDQRLAGYIDMEKEERPDLQIADKIVEDMHINSVEEFLGKAQAVVDIVTDDTTGEITSFLLEYELAEGQILVVRYRNEACEEVPGFYVSYFRVRSPYYINQREITAGAAVYSLSPIRQRLF